MNYYDLLFDKIMVEQTELVTSLINNADNNLVFQNAFYAFTNTNSLIFENKNCYNNFIQEINNKRLKLIKLFTEFIKHNLSENNDLIKYNEDFKGIILRYFNDIDNEELNIKEKIKDIIFFENCNWYLLNTENNIVDEVILEAGIPLISYKKTKWIGLFREGTKFKNQIFFLNLLKKIEYPENDHNNHYSLFVEFMIRFSNEIKQQNSYYKFYT